MIKLTLQTVDEIKTINGVSFPKDVDLHKLIISGPPGSGKTTILKSIRGWPEEGYLDLSSKNWWKSPNLAHKPRELHFGLPFKGYQHAVPVYDIQSLDHFSYLELDLFRILLPQPKQNFLSADFRSKMIFEFNLLAPEKLFALRKKRAEQASHHIDNNLTLEQIEEEVSLYNTLALFFHQSGMNVYVRDELGGLPKRILDDEKQTSVNESYRKNLYQLHDQLKLRQRILNRSWSVRGNNELLELFVRLLPGALNVERCNIFLSDQNQNKVWLLCGTALSGKQVVASQIRPLVKKVIESGASIIEENMQQEAHAEVNNSFVLHNTLLAPIRSVMEDKTTGVIQLLNKKGKECFNDEDQLLLEKVALHLQLAMENIYLRKEMMDFSEILSHKAEQNMGWIKILSGVLLLLLAASLWGNAHQAGLSLMDVLKMLP